MIEGTKLYKFIISDENLFRAIYSLESCVFEPELLSKQDLVLFYRLRDKLDDYLIRDTMEATKERINNVLLKDKVFSLRVFFKPKKLDPDTGKIESRPIHTASLLDQIAMVAMLNSLLFDVNDDKMTLSQIALSMPPNFFGNIPSADPKYLFVPWREKYKEYTEKVTQSYERFVKTKEYSHEVSLDMVNFFPSLNPFLVYDHIVTKHGARYSGLELECFKMVLFKLLCAKVEGLDSLTKCYYDGPMPGNWCNFVRGIPQGLPQAYFFGNIGMISVVEVFEEELLSGISYYYVDDSVIFCNHTGKDFASVVQRINEGLAGLSQIEQFNPSSLPESDWSEPFLEYCTPEYFCLRVHEEGTKSSIMEIGLEGLGLSYLNALGREASIGAFEVRTTFSEDEDLTVKNKLKVIRESLEAEMDRIDELTDEKSVDNYRKSLVRLRKFFKFRERLLEYQGSPNTELDDFFDILNVCDMRGQFNPARKELFFEVYNEDIFLPELLFRLRNNPDPDGYKKIRDLVSAFDRAAYGTNKGTYLTKVIGAFAIGFPSDTKIDYPYQSATRYVNRTLPDYSKTPYHIRMGAFCKQLNDFCNESGAYGDFVSERSYMRLVNNSTNDLQRRIFNAFISRVLNVEISDEAPVYRLDKRPLSLNEYRILLYIRNPRCDIKHFLRFAEARTACDSSKAVDVTVTEVVNYFLTYLRDPDLIDDLLLVHDYTTAMWKNGSKHLHFYTLHDQEHAMELIKAVIKITKTIRHFSLSKEDYYVLFISCYLHDISMALHPDLNMAFCDSNPKSDLIVSDFRREIAKRCHDLDSAEASQIKKMLLRYYSRIDRFFENHVRDHHHQDSAEFIRTTPDIGFLDNATRDLVSEVSKAHGYSPRDIYGVRSKADSFTINKKYVAAVLRLADLLDMADDRISQPILDNSNIYMLDITHFHWLSHQVISGYELNTEYSNSALISGGGDSSYLKHGNFEEKVVLTINLNAWQEEFVDCRVCDYKVLEKRNSNSYTLRIIGRKDEGCDQQCLFLCRWMTKKHGYLFQELSVLQQYLDKCENYFKTKIMVELRAGDNATPLGREQYQLVSEMISKDGF